MDTHVINLDRNPERWAAFEARNQVAWGRIQRRPAVDGATLDRAELLKSGIIAADLRYADGALGNALSHLALWDLALERNAPLTVCEDDAIFNRNFFAAADPLVAALPPDWHVVFWGWNFDSLLGLDLIPGVSPCLCRFDQTAMRKGVPAFQAADLKPQLFRLMWAFGIVCYAVSPEGARLLRQFCVPLRAMSVPIPAFQSPLANNDLGVMINALLRRINAFASFPPLVITLNDHASSTVQKPRQGGPVPI